MPITTSCLRLCSPSKWRPSAYKIFWVLLLLEFEQQIGTHARSANPHIIFILADDLGWNDVSFHGSNEIPTPNIDSLAYRGIILNNYYVNPICSPSRSALLTGKHPIHTGMQVDVIYGPQPYGLGLSEKLISQHLNDLGYVSHIVGKWHQGFFRHEYTPLYRGFRSHFGYWCGHQDYYTHTAEESANVVGFDMRRNMSIAWDTVGNYTTHLFTQEAINIIEEHDKSRVGKDHSSVLINSTVGMGFKHPLFLLVSQLAVHSGNSYDPIQAPADYVNRFSYIKDLKRRKFAGVLTALDESVGNITRALIFNHMLNNSIVVFTTDNGGAAGGFNDNAASNWPLKGTKDTLWEGGVRGSAFVWSPLLQNSGTVSHQLMSVEDWLPTLYSAAGGNVVNLGFIDGIDMWRALSDGSPSPRVEVLHNIDDVRNVSAIRIGDFKLVQGRTYGGTYDKWFGPPQGDTKIRNFRYLYRNPLHNYLNGFTELDEPQLKRLLKQAAVVCGQVPTNASKECIPTKPCLFNVTLDPCEFHNVAEDMPDVVKSLLKRLQFYRTTAAKPRNVPFDKSAYPVYHGYAWIPWKG